MHGSTPVRQAPAQWFAGSLGPGRAPVVDDVGVAVAALRRTVALPPVLGVVCEHLPQQPRRRSAQACDTAKFQGNANANRTLAVTHLPVPEHCSSELHCGVDVML